jgi:DNA-binding transcriptional LysR family regulator
MDRLDAMRLFLRVADLGSFSRAADEADIGQPTVSRRIQELETHLGVQLFLRTTRALSLTEAGQRFYARAARIVADTEEAETEARSLDREPVGLLRLTASNSFARFLIAPHLPDFATAYPHVKVEILATEQRLDLVESGIDLAFRLGALEDSSLTARRLGQSYRHVFATPAYLQKRGAITTPEDLHGHDCIVFTSSSAASRWTFVRGDAHTEVEVDGRFRLSSGELIRDAVLAHMGVALMPCFLLRPEIESKAVEVLLNDWTLPPVPLHAVWASGRNLPRKARVFLEFIEQRLKPAFGS